MKKAATALATIVSFAVAAYSFWLVVVGQRVISVEEGSPISEILLIPAPAALIPLIGALSILAGLYFRQPKIYWLGFSVLGIFSGLFLFGIGGPLIPAAALLFVLLLIMQFQKSSDVIAR